MLSDLFDLLEFLFKLIIVPFIIIGTIVLVYNLDTEQREKDCFDYYKENGYLLNSCKDYEYKIKMALEGGK